MATEVEFTLKKDRDLRDKLRAYRAHGHLFSKVIYFTQSTEIASAIKRIDANDVGLGDLLVIRKYTPRDRSALFLG